MPRRGQFDPFAQTDELRWLVVESLWREQLECERLEPGSDLRSAFARSMDRYRADGWTIENETPTYPTVFVNRESERRMLAIIHVDPAIEKPKYFSPWPTFVP